VRISEVQVASATQATVVWTCTNADSNSLSAGSLVTMPANMVSTSMIPNANATPATTGAYFIMGEVSYNYVPPFTFRGAGAMTFTDRIFLVPRSATNIPLNGSCS